ncbi:MAG: M23 family metallopeptidase [Rudanella sp.]|nr:M23 family metallopeptidase [Rudanella sp.]
MNYILLLFLLISVSTAQAQVLFTHRANVSEFEPGGSPMDTVYMKASPLRVTYFGKPLADRDALGSLSRPSELEWERERRTGYKQDSLLVLLDALRGSLQRDSTLLSVSLGEGTGSELNLLVESVGTLWREVPSIMPVRIRSWSEYRVSSQFGLRWHPIREKLHNHSGVDFPMPIGTPVYATADGVVDRLVYQSEGLGLAVYIQHPSGYVSVYGHLSAHRVRPGLVVERGEEIGKVGSSGLSTGPHLHYSVLKGGIPVDPLDFCFLLLRTLRNRNKDVVRDKSVLPRRH